MVSEKKSCAKEEVELDESQQTEQLSRKSRVFPQRMKKDAEAFAKKMDGEIVTRGPNIYVQYDVDPYKSTKKEEVEEGKKLDPVNDKENDKKFKDRKDKDIDNDGDVDGSDEYLHKKRAATDDAIDGGDKPADNEEPAETDKEPKKKKKGSNPKTDDKTAEISKIGETFEIMWAEIEEALNQKKGATEPEKMDDKESPKGKEFKAKHSVDVKSHDDMEKIEEPKKREVKKEMTEYEVIAKILSGKIED